MTKHCRVFLLPLMQQLISNRFCRLPLAEMNLIRKWLNILSEPVLRKYFVMMQNGIYPLCLFSIQIEPRQYRGYILHQKG